MGCGQLVSDDDGTMCAKCGAKGGGATVAIGARASRVGGPFSHAQDSHCELITLAGKTSN